MRPVGRLAALALVLAALLPAACGKRPPNGTPQPIKPKWSLALSRPAIAVGQMHQVATVRQVKGAPECAAVRWEMYGGGDGFSLGAYLGGREHAADCGPGQGSDPERWEFRLSAGIYTLVAFVTVRGQLMARLWRGMEVR